MKQPQDLERYTQYYSARKFWKKIGKYARRIGVKAVFYALVLYYALLDSDLPAKDKRIILGALGYLILPLDLLPDFLPGGFTDDVGALALAIFRLARNITPEVRARAEQKLEEWFGSVPDEDKSLDITGFQD